MELINESNELTSINLSVDVQNTLYGLVRLNLYPLRDSFDCPEWDNLKKKLARVKGSDKPIYVFSASVPMINNSDKYFEIVVNMDENFSVVGYMVSFLQIND